MFSIVTYTPEIEAKTLTHSANVFHEALADGGDYYHVSVPMGSYDISYRMNHDWFAANLPAYAGKTYPDYLTYDEYDAGSIDLITFKDYEQLFCKQLTEYSIAIARIALANTTMSVYFVDPRAAWFFAPNDRVHIGQPPADRLTLMLVGAIGYPFARNVGGVGSNFPMSDIRTFHSLFWIQNELNGRSLKDIRYLEFPYGKSNIGIGALLVKTKEAEIAAKQLGWEIAYNGDVIGKFRVTDLAKFYKLDYRRPDSTPENTISLFNASTLSLIRRTYEIHAVLDDTILCDSFRHELAEYEEAVLGGHRTLGLLIRGTDYISSGLSSSMSRRQATAEEMLPVVREWMESGSYDRVFLATEDKDILNQMRETLGSKVVAVSQERHSVSEFEKGQVINELEKQLYSEEEYNDRVIETTINYFYALHILSNCQAFLCSGQNNGWDTVCAMNGGRFERCERMNASPAQQ